MMMRSLASLLCLVFLSVVNSQDYAEYARGAGMARKKSSRCLAPHFVETHHAFRESSSESHVFESVSHELYSS